MKLGVQILAYNVTRFIGAAIDNAGPHVDVIYVAYSARAFGYNPEQRDVANRTDRADLFATRFPEKTVVIDGDWALEEEARNACLERARLDGCDYMLVQDADELYPNESWELNKTALAEGKLYQVYKTPWYNFWKTPEYVIEYFDGTIVNYNATFAVACASDMRFIRKRVTNADQVGILPGICFHYGYVLTDEEMIEKISTWGHTKEMFHLQGWYRYKWLGWTPKTRNLHVVYPSEWRRAVKFNGECPSFGASLDVLLHRSPRSRFHWLGDGLYDTGVALRVAARLLKRSLVRLLGRVQHWLKLSMGLAS